MTTFVLVPGMWLGGWAWRQVAHPLRASGHNVYPVTLTGLGERVHLGGPHVNLNTHIADVVNLLRYEELHDVVLVGHSYAANVISGVAAQVPERIARLVYVDTWPLPDGVAQIDLNPPEARQAQEQQVGGLAATAAVLGGVGPGQRASWAWRARTAPDARTRRRPALRHDNTAGSAHESGTRGAAKDRDLV
jgi:pimeloyl-ACP methyl ester carboxylesterase